MKILFDQGTPVPRRVLTNQLVATAFEKGWSNLSNGNLLQAAESDLIYSSRRTKIRHPGFTHDKLDRFRISCSVSGV